MAARNNKIDEVYMTA